jgi:hypothetical protein
MAQTIDELTIEYVDEGVTTIKQLDKIVLTKGAWSTIVYKYQDWEKAKQRYSPPKYSIRRYQKRNDQYNLKSKFNISSTDQAQKLIEILNHWIAEDGKAEA